VNITVEQITSVDKDIILTATREDLNPRFDKALKNIRKKATIPGFRVGQAPMQLIRKRFGKDVEAEEINDFVQETFRDTIYTEHKPVGEPKITELKWENDILEVRFRIGVKPEIELVDLSTITVDKLLHDVTDEDVDKEIEHALSRNGVYDDSEEPIEENSKITADVEPLDDHGHGTGIETDQEIDLNEPSNEDIRKAVAGKNIGDTVEVEVGHGDHTHKYKLTIKSHQKLTKADLNEDFIVKQSRDNAKTEDEYRSYLKSQVQDYFDKTSNDLYREAIAEKLVESHDFEVPESIIDYMINSYFEDYKKRVKDKLPAHFDMEEFRSVSMERARNESKWMFIQETLMEKYPDVEITPEDVDVFINAEAIKYGLAPEMIKQYYASSGEMMESLRTNLRSQKLFDKLTAEVVANPMDKNAFENRNK
jgi:trigger factor